MIEYDAYMVPFGINSGFFPSSGDIHVVSQIFSLKAHGSSLVSSRNLRTYLISKGLGGWGMRQGTYEIKFNYLHSRKKA